MSSRMKTLIKGLLPLVIVAAGIALAVWLIKTKPQPKRQETTEIATPVRILKAEPISEALQVDAAGTVLPAKRIEVRPQVSGQVIELDDRLGPGGRFNTGETLLRIDPRDYEFALAQRKSQLAQAQFEVSQEEGRAAVAQREWELLGEEVETTAEGRALALREPQLARARAALEAAKSSVAEAELNLARTTITAPFNALVQQENVDPGQTVNPNTTIAVLTGTDAYWVQASIAVEDLAYLNSNAAGDYAGIPATIIHQTGNREFRKPGRVLRLLPDLDEAGRMARLLIVVDDPLGLDSQAGEMPLLLGAFVRVQLAGRSLDGVYRIPAEAIREGDQLWLMNNENRLDIKDADIVQRGPDTVLVRGLQPGDRLVASRIGTPVPGMLLLPLDEADNSPAEKPGGAP